MSSANKPGPIRDRRPVGVSADHRPEIGRLHFQAAAEIHLVGLDDAGLRILDRPHHAGEHGGGDLETGGVLIGRDVAGFVDRKLRPVPVGVLLVAVEQDAELVDAVGDLVLVQNVDGRLPLAGLAEQLMQRQHRVVAGVVGVVTGRAVDGLAAVSQREEVRDRDRFVMRDQEAVLRLGRRRPRAHPRIGAGLGQVDCRLTAGLMLKAVLRQLLLMGTPAELGRLHAL